MKRSGQKHVKNTQRHQQCLENETCKCVTAGCKIHDCYVFWKRISFTIGESNSKLEVHQKRVLLMHSLPRTFITENRLIFPQRRSKSQNRSNKPQQKQLNKGMLNDMANWLLQKQKSMLTNVNRYSRVSVLFILNQHIFISLAHTVKFSKGKKQDGETYL